MSTSATTGAILVTKNVVKQFPVASIVATLASFDPCQVRTESAAGGFNFVCEIAASACLRFFSESAWEDLGSAELSGPDLLSLLETSDEPFDSTMLNTLRGTSLNPLPLTEFRARMRHFQPHSLTFNENGTVRIRYSVQVDAFWSRVKLQLPPAYAHPLPGDVNTDISVVIDSAGRILGPAVLNRSSTDPGAPATLLLVDPFRPVARLDRTMSSPSMRMSTARNLRSLPTIHDTSAVFGLPGGTIGSLVFDIVCPYTAHTNSWRRSVRVCAEVAAATVSPVDPSPDMQRLLEGNVFGYDCSLIARHLALGEAALTPEISPVGTPLIGYEPTELSSFAPRLFPVSNGKHEALAIAASVTPTGSGIPEEVTHFIGDADYGVIADEQSIAKCVNYQWRARGGPINLPLVRPTIVSVDGKTENAVLYGALTLDTLESVTIGWESNSDMAVIHLGGNATVRADRAELQDGRMVEDLEQQVPPKTLPWTLAAEPRVEPIYSADPDIAAVQHVVSSRLLSHIARPITIADITAIYARTNAATKQFYCLGSF